jgi:chemotaxis protein CheX
MMVPHTEMILQLVESTRRVFETMVFKKLEHVMPIEGNALRPKSNVVGLVGFGGSMSGLIAFYSTMEAAQEIAGAMLDLPAADMNGEMADAIGEITNMIAGGFRLRMAGHGERLAISIPSVTVGSDFYTRFATDVSRIMCPFKMDEREVCVELILMRK